MLSAKWQPFCTGPNESTPEDCFSIYDSSSIPCDLVLKFDIDGLVQDCGNSSVLAMELLQSCAKPLVW